MSDSASAGTPSYRRPAGLFFEPPGEQPDEEHFFGLELLSDPAQLLARSTELAVAFRTAADRAVDYQAMAAAQLADRGRFDRLPEEAIASRAGWSEDYAKKMIEYGRALLRQRSAP